MVARRCWDMAYRDVPLHLEDIHIGYAGWTGAVWVYVYWSDSPQSYEKFVFGETLGM